MCFSASASFAASGGLALIGAASLRAAPKEQRVLAVISLLFSVQQALEGIQWLAIDQGYVCRSAGYGFLFFALLLWPIYIPMTVYLLDKTRRRITSLFILSGAILATWYSWLLITTPLVIQIIGRHIFYSPPGYSNFKIADIVYVAIVFGTLIFSHRKVFRLLGIVTIITAFIASAISMATSASVWCFFAACISVSIYFTIRCRWLPQD